MMYNDLIRFLVWAEDCHPLMPTTVHVRNGLNGSHQVSISWYKDDEVSAKIIFIMDFNSFEFTCEIHKDNSSGRWESFSVEYNSIDGDFENEPFYIRLEKEVRELYKAEPSECPCTFCGNRLTIVRYNRGEPEKHCYGCNSIIK